MLELTGYRKCNLFFVAKKRGWLFSPQALLRCFQNQGEALTLCAGRSADCQGGSGRPKGPGRSGGDLEGKLGPLKNSGKIQVDEDP